MLTQQQQASLKLPEVLSRKLAKQCARWYWLKDHPVQKKLVTDLYRFKCVPAGRRSGKTDMHG